MREIMGAVSRWYDDTKGVLVTAGSGNNYTLASNSSHAALADQSFLIFRADRANTGAATLAVDGLAAKALESGGAAIVSGDIIIDSVLIVAYNANNDAYEILNTLTASQMSTKLGLGALATQATVNNDDWSGTDLAVVNGGTGASDQATARTNIGVGTGNSVEFSQVNVGHATDSTIHRTGAGLLNLEDRPFIVHEDDTMASGKVWTETTGPTGGANGDIWLEHEA